MFRYAAIFWTSTIILIIDFNLINGQQQRTHFPLGEKSNFKTKFDQTPVTQSKVLQCPIYTECRPIVECVNQNELKSDPKKLNYCGWRHGLPMICCGASSEKTQKNFKNKFLNSHTPKGNSKSSRMIRNFEICGTRVKQISLYIVGGNQVVSNTKYPWFASIALTGSSYPTDQDENSATNLHHYCGGSIISDNFVISSAHCFPLSGLDDSELENYRIGVGNIELSQMQIHEVESVIIHPKASSDSHYNDIALVKIKDRFKFSSRIRPICLPFLEFGSDNELSDKFENVENDFNHDKFKSTEQELQMYGFPNPNYSPPFYGFPNYQPPNEEPKNHNLHKNRHDFRNRPSNQYPIQYPKPFQTNNFYGFRVKRSVDPKFEQLDLYDEIFVTPGSDVTIAGLGDTSFGGVRASTLKEADLMIVDKSKCNELYMKLNSPSLKKGLNEEFICAADRRLANKLNSQTSSLIDPRAKPRSNRSKRSISFWIDYFSNLIKENRSTRTKKKGGLSRTNDGDGDKMDRQTSKHRERRIEKNHNKNNRSETNSSIRTVTSIAKANNDSFSDKKKEDEKIASDDFVITEEEIREKLAFYSDACQGDSGGGLQRMMDSHFYNKTMQNYRNDPLIKDAFKKNFDITNDLYDRLNRKGLEGRFMLVGVVSLGRNCGENFPGVYTNINFHKDWILQNLNGINFNDLKYRL